MKFPAETTQFDVLKCTTQQLQDMLNGYSDGWDIRMIEFVGGRDWVIIATYEHEDAESRERDWASTNHGATPHPSN